MDEFGLIEKYFAPLTKNFAGAYNLQNDAAVFSPEKGNEIVISVDAITEGVHFLKDTAPALIAKKMVRVNVSDMAAMGAKPRYYLMTSSVDKRVNKKWVNEFAKSLAEEQEEFGITLLGGDTVYSKGPMTFSFTIIGEVKKGGALTRSGAKVGDDVYVSGRIGDAALGLNILKKNRSPLPPALGKQATARQGMGEQLRGLQQKASKRGGASGGNEMPPHDSLRSSTPPPGGSGNHLIQKYLIPQPRVELGRGLVGVANAAIDVSDGLLADLNHICKNSGVGASIHQEKIPVFNDKYFELAVTGGDDYELLFTAPQSARQKVQKLAKQSKTKVALIGSITRKKDLQILGRHGKPLTFKRLGYKHF